MLTCHCDEYQCPCHGELSSLETLLAERLAQHKDSLRLWENGYLNPTEPDEQERACVRRELRAASDELQRIIDHIKFRRQQRENGVSGHV